MMSDSDEQKQQSGLPPGGFSLGGLKPGEFDTSLSGEAAGEEEHARTYPGQVPGEERLALPRGALVAFRKSGGMRFTSRGVVVTKSGWIEPMEGTSGRRRHLTPEALAVLERLLLQSGLTRVSQQAAGATRDGYAYEIAAHVGGKVRSVELHDPVPEEQRRLVRVLNRLLPVQ